MSRKRRKRAPDRPEPRTAPAGAPAATPAQGRRWLFRAILLLIPLAAVLLSELALRAAGYGTPLDFVLRREVEGQARLLSNPRFTWLFFEPSQARVPPPFSLPVRKPAGAVRVFVLGSSAAQGDPEPAFGIARQLEVLLRDQYPGAEIEVVNAAVTAVNSHYVYAAARAALELSPDVLVVYEGNNEVVGPFGAGTVFTAAAPPLPLVRAAVAARRTRLGQLVGSAVRVAATGLGRSSRAAGAWHGMKMFLEQQVRAGDPALERAYRNFEGNLAGVCRMARRAGVPVVLSTVAVNLASCGPFASAEAVQLYRSGREESSRGGGAKARRLLERARDLDTLRFRADSRVNAIVRAVASQEAARLVDAEELLARESPRGAPGDESFLDHVHLSFHGNYLLATALLDAVRDALPEPVRRRASASPPPGEAEVARRLVFTDLDRYNIAETMQRRLREPPFTNQPDHAEHEKRFADEMALLRARGDAGGVEAAVAEYERALAAPSPHWSLRERYAGIVRRLRRPGVAAEQLERLTRQFPQQPGFELLLSRALRDAGRFGEARAALQKVLDYQPDAAVTLVELAQLELAQGRPLEARAAARRAAGLDPFDANALNVLAASLCPGLQCGPAERKEAIDLLTRALEIAPESEDLKRGLQALRGGPPGSR
jgi:tetratricopeptide (TPR) repeat protein